jgi:hypothetical protein
MTEFNFFKQNVAYLQHADVTDVAQRFYVTFWDFTRNAKGTFDRFNYSGETLISFRPISGCAIRLMSEKYFMAETTSDRLKYITKYDDFNIIPQETKGLFVKFHKIYHSIANFMPLPNKPLKFADTEFRKLNPQYKMFSKNMLNELKDYREFKKNDFMQNFPESLDQYKENTEGHKPLHDFPDKFFKLIKAYYDDNFTDSEKHPSVCKANKSYFEMFGSWKGYVEGNYLQDFFKDDDYEEFIELSPPESLPMPYCRSYIPKCNPTEVLEYIHRFLETSIDIIHKRAERLENVKI